MTEDTPQGALDVLVIGGGQAGLAAGFHLSKTGLRYRILDAGKRTGDSWRARYPSLTLFTPRNLSELPGMRLDGDRDCYAGRDEFADYLERYAARFQLPVTLEAEIVDLSSDGPNVFVVKLGSGEELRAGAVIVANGAFQTAQVPGIAASLADTVMQFTSRNYRGGAQIPEGTVLVVGDGATGRDLAVELSATHQTHLATGRRRRMVPERLLGRSVWWWLGRLGLLNAKPGSAIGRAMRRSDPFPDRNRNLRHLSKLGIKIRPRVSAASGDSITFADGTECRISAVVWTVGYADDSGWISIPAVRDQSGRVRHDGGISPVPGLYFVGRPWQRNRMSALVMGAGPDAEYIVRKISEAATTPSELRARGRPRNASLVFGRKFAMWSGAVVCPASTGATEAKVLFDDGHEQVRLERCVSGAVIAIDNPRGLELFVLTGSVRFDREALGRHSWVRLPAGTSFKGVAGPEGATLWLRDAPLLHPDVLRLP